MNNYSKDELSMILSLYIFDGKRISDKILNDFCVSYYKTFNININRQNAMYLMSIFKNIDPTYNITNNIDNKYIDFYNVWDDYINHDRITELKENYKLFKKGLLTINLNSEVNYSFDFNDDIENIYTHFIEDSENIYIVDTPKDLYSASISEIELNKRREEVKFNSLKLANFKCECNEEHISFIRKKIPINYTEGHHLIPLKYQYDFKYNLDVEANIISLCPNCHRLLHYGKHNVDLLKVLYENRIYRLRNCGLDISFDSLLEMYK